MKNLIYFKLLVNEYYCVVIDGKIEYLVDLNMSNRIGNIFFPLYDLHKVKVFRKDNLEIAWNKL